MAGPAPRGFALSESFTHRLHTLQKLTDRLTQAAYESDVGMALSEGRCLSAIGSFSPLSVNDLASRANLNKAQASRAAQSLVDQALVRKGPSPTDGRGVVLSLTTKGEHLWARLAPVIARRNAEITSCLSAAEQRQFSALLDRLVAHAREAAGIDAAADDTLE